MKRLNHILLAGGIVFLAYLLWKVGLRELWRELTLLGWGLIPLVLGEGVAEMIHTIGWRHCLSGPIRHLPWATLFRIRMAGYAINYLTPTAALGGEVTKGTLLAARHPGPEAASGVLIGKVCFALAHLIFVAAGALLLFGRLPISTPVRWAMLAGGAIMAGCIMTLLLVQKFGKLGAVLRWLAKGKPASHPFHQAARSLTGVDETLTRFYRERPLDLFQAMGWHLIGYSVGIVQTWFFFRLLHADASWVFATAVWFLGMWFDLLTFAVPLNLGTLEGSRALVFKAIGYTSAMGVAYGLAQRLAQMFWSVFGLICHGLLVSREAQARQPSPAAVRSFVAVSKPSDQ
jgi:hypothetical protein